ncbi:hypothetical protein CAL7716_072880 [Calothrix sp. PCC 7716]|nr:hypothetical protein CAL7716_072880 [Calothrix sp. PCC 7716]
MLCINDLLKLELFQHLPQRRLDWVCERASLLELAAGEILVRGGERGNYNCKVPKIMAYGSELNQVWTNLIDNAIYVITDKCVI